MFLQHCAAIQEPDGQYKDVFYAVNKGNILAMVLSRLKDATQGNHIDNTKYANDVKNIAYSIKID